MAASDRKNIYRRVGFTENPFGVTADPRFHYLSSQHRVVLDNLQAIVDDHQGLAVVEGAIGVGKSMLARRLFVLYQREPDAYKVLYLHTAAYRTAFEALSDIAERFGVNMPKGLRSARAKRKEFERWLLEQARNKITVVLIIDDAQMMAPDVLDVFHFLYNYDWQEKLIQTVLFGQTEIRDLFDAKKALRSRVVAWETLLPMEDFDALNMINYRCQVAGRARSIMESSAWTKVYAASGNGNPRTLVLICQEVVKHMARAGLDIADDALAMAAIAHYQQRPGEAPDGSRQLSLEDAMPAPIDEASPARNGHAPRRRTQRKKV